MAVLAGMVLVGCGYKENVTGNFATPVPTATAVPTPEVGVTPQPGLPELTVRRLFEPGFSPPRPGTETVEAADASTGPVLPAEGQVDEVSGVKVGSGRTDWASLVASVFPAWAVPRAMDILYCESGGNPWATGSSGERGLFQIHPIHFDSTYDPLGNVRAAYRISRGGTDWSAWSCA